MSIIIESKSKVHKESSPSNFGTDLEFLKKHTDVIVLSDEKENSMLAIVPEWQGRVMTSSASGLSGRSFGWINRELISSGKILPHINVFGGEDRFWLGPEGGQYSIYFKKGAKFELSSWYVPKELDTEPFELLSSNNTSAKFNKIIKLQNYSSNSFIVNVEREVNLIDVESYLYNYKLDDLHDISSVGYESNNKITNAGENDWNKKSGLLSIWILGMFNPTPNTTVIVPFKNPSGELSAIVNDNYFGKVAKDRLTINDSAIFFKGDGLKRSKIGVSKKRSKSVLGSYDSDNKVLTIIEFNLPEDFTEYVNSLWEIQDEPYNGDVVNSYNDGPPEPGAKPLGPFYELETSSPAVELKIGESVIHTHKTLHFTGNEESLNLITTNILGVSIKEIQSVF